MDAINQKIKRIDIRYLKKYSDTNGVNELKTNINCFEIKKDNLEYSILTNYLVNKKTFEVYLCISDGKISASLLLYKTFKNRLCASVYYYILSKIIIHYDIKKISQIVTAQNKQ